MNFFSFVVLIFSLVFCLLLGLTSGPLTALELVLDLCDGAVPPQRVQVQLLGLSDSQQQDVESLGRTITRPFASRLDLPFPLSNFPVSGVQLQVQAEGFWTPPQPVTGLQGELTVTLYPSRELRFALVPPRNEAAPAQVHLAFAPVGTMSGGDGAGDTVNRSEPSSGKGDELQPLWSSRCTETTLPEATGQRASAAVMSGRWSCPIPLQVGTVRLDVPGYASRLLTGLSGSSEKVQDLGKVQIQRGAVLSGRVEGPEGVDWTVGGTTVVLRPASEPAGSEPEHTMDLSLAPRTAVQGSGGFSLHGVAAGAYVVEARQAPWLPARSRPVTVEAGQRLELDTPLRLQAEVALRVEITPQLDHEGEPWHLELVPWQGHPRRSRAGLAGRVVFTGLKAGNYHLVVASSRGQRFADQEIQVPATGLDLALDLPLVFLRGRLVQGGQPLAARLAFGGRSGATSIALESGEDGRFQGVLPRSGLWAVDVEAPEISLFRRLAEVRVPESKSGIEAWLEIELPDTALEGRVVDAEGEGVAGATVLLLGLPAVEMPSFQRSDTEGSFRFAGLEPGTFRLEAQQMDSERGHRASVPVDVELDGSGILADVELELRPPRVLRGIVSSIAGPVSGARVTAIADHGEQRMGLLVADGHSDEAGRFELSLPAGERFRVHVEAVGFALQIHELRPDFNTGLNLHLDQVMGTLRLELERPYDQLDPRRQPPRIVHTGETKLALGNLLRWAHANGAEQEERWVTIPNLPTGHYEVCWPESTSESTESENQYRQCREGTLVHQGTLSLGRPGA